MNTYELDAIRKGHTEYNEQYLNDYMSLTPKEIHLRAIIDGLLDHIKEMETAKNSQAEQGGYNDNE